ncbi:MAG: cupin domain-containing protein [Hyphomicrobiales bacterium]
MPPENFFNIDDLSAGIARELAEGIETRIINGDHAMVSIVRIEPNKKGTWHHHPEEQWGFCLEGSGTRFQGGESVEISIGDFWRTPGGVPHTIESGKDGLVVIDVFAPPRKAYEKASAGFGAEEE